MFGKLFGQTWKEYWRSFKGISQLFLVFYLLPYALYTFFASTNRPSFSPFFIIGFLLLFALLVPSLLLFTMTIASSSLKGKKIKFSDYSACFQGRYWAFLGFSISLGLLLTGLTILLIIPGIIFGVFWSLSTFVFLKENKKILASLKRSKQLVRGRWWKTFGYFVLLLIFTILISIIWQGIVEIFLSEVISPILISIKIILIFLPAVITAPFFILFYKNLYLEYKKGRKK